MKNHLWGVIEGHREVMRLVAIVHPDADLSDADQLLEKLEKFQSDLGTNMSKVEAQARLVWQSMEERYYREPDGDDDL